MPPMKFVWKMHVFFRHLVILTSKRDHPKDLSEGEIYPFWRWKVRSYQVCSSSTFSLSDTFREKNMWPSKEKMQYILLRTNTVKWNRRLVCLWSKISTFQTDFLPPKSSGLPMPTSMFNTTCESFQLRYCMTLYLKGHQNYQMSKFKNPKKSAFIK